MCNIKELLKTYWLIAVIPIVYLAAIILLTIIKLLLLKDLINYLVIFVGWLVALSMIFIQLKKTRENNQVLKREEIKKSLEIGAFKDINKAIDDFSGIINEIHIYYFFSLPIQLKLHISSPALSPFKTNDIEQEIAQRTVNFHKGIAEFIVSIEANEIAVIKYDYLRKYIQLKFEDAGQLIENFKDFFRKATLSELETTKKNEFNAHCEKISKQLIDIGGYLFDYRIELMNELLGDIFNNRVPRRKPRDPNCKILTELAIKDEVEREEEERYQRIEKGLNPSKE